jgi:hypothetical protein
MISRATAVFFLVAILSQLHAQESISFTENQHDFGTIKEEDGPVEHTFRFLNTSEESIKVNYVKASCGCTTPAWSREFILPGDSGFITARYNPFNRPGPFRKSLTVTTSDGGRMYLYIQGSVRPRPKSVEEELPTKIGALRVKYRSFNMGRMTTEKPVRKEFEVYNDSDSAIVFLPEQQFPDFISVEFLRDTLLSKERASIFITFDPGKRGDLGFLRDNLTIKTTDPLSPDKSFLITTTVTEYFPPMSQEEMKKAPRLFIGDPSFDFGDLQVNTVKEGTIELINNGQNTLNIRKVDSNCDCLQASLPANDIKPGQSIQMKVIFDGEGRRGRQYKTLTVFSNDPLAPTQVISVKADVNN